MSFTPDPLVSLIGESPVFALSSSLPRCVGALTGSESARGHAHSHRSESLRLPALDQPATLVGDSWVCLDEGIAVIADPHQDRWVRLTALASLQPVMGLLADAGTERSTGLAEIARPLPYFSYRFGPPLLLAGGLTNPERASERATAPNR